MKRIEELNTLKIVQDIKQYKELFWLNGAYNNSSYAFKTLDMSISDMIDAESRLHRFKSYLKLVFADLDDGIIESELIKLDSYTSHNVFLKGDHALPVSGSIKARGGIYEILKLAERLLLENQLLRYEDDYKIIADETFNRFFSNYEIVVSSTGNLGLSIGIISAKLGFKVYVHMSHDAMTWKKEKLRSLGVHVIEHKSDYSKAVEIGRAESKKKKNSFFIDDENSKDLFMGYAVAAFRLEKQLNAIGVSINKDKPLFVYLPCGVGGGPGGIAFGLKQVFKDNVHCVFVEPTHAPCMLLGLATDTHNQYSVQDFGLDNLTAADGLAVGRASKFVGRTVKELLLGVSTVNDDFLFNQLRFIRDEYSINLEPSALAGFKGLNDVIEMPDLHGNITITTDQIKNGTHIVWATGGSMVPENIMNEYYKRNK